MSPTVAPGDAHSDIATRLAIRLVAVGAFTGFCNWIFLQWASVLSVPFILLVDVIAVWFAVHYAFDALNDLLTVKLAALDEQARTGD
ncbi:hypothetical protein [Natrinema caseinilyticum]|uniref:hypothetical protein n=1 Tax=Natrinema caseinilyticum TaxID=2961570 RepID=UPI0020C1C2E6|nr:hypothetical protein [Natrinema caseinilyticum]